MPKTHTEIKAFRQSTFRTGQAFTHIVGFNIQSRTWEALQSELFASYSAAKQWAYHYAHNHHLGIPYIWLGCMSDDQIKHTFAQPQKEAS